MQNFSQTVLGQYKSSPALMTILRAISQWFSPDAPIESFYDNCFNILTAVEEGLNVWGRIVVIPRVLTIASYTAFGFGEAGDRACFDFGPFGDYITTAVQNVTLTDDAYRALIFAKAAFNITDGSIPAINYILMNILFPGRGNAWVSEGGSVAPYEFGFGEAGDRLRFAETDADAGPFGDLISIAPTNMTLQYNFDFPLEPFEIAMVKSGVLPKPTGVPPSWNYTAAAA